MPWTGTRTARVSTRHDDTNSNVEAAYSMGYQRGLTGKPKEPYPPALTRLEGFDADYSAAYEQGWAHGHRDARPPRSAAQGGRRHSRAVARRRATARAPKTVRGAARQLAAPVRAEATSAMQAIGLMFLVIALYLLLDRAQKFAGFIGGINRALQWLVSPRRSIAYAPN